MKPSSSAWNVILSSFHPTSLKQGLPYSQFLRVRICSDDQDFRTETDKIYSQFLARGYSKDTLDRAFHKVNLAQNDTQANKRRKKDHSVICCTIYTPRTNQIEKIIKKHWDILNTDQACATLFRDPPLFAHSRARNIRDIVVHADTFDRSKTPWERLDNAKGFFPCRNCTSCTTTGMKKINKFKCSKSGKEYTINKFITCSPVNVIYLLTCPCGLQYIGKTNRQLRIRINEHRSAIHRQDNRSSVARHFSMAEHKMSDLEVVGIEHLSPSRRSLSPSHRSRDMESKLRQCEASWIFYMGTLSPGGLNEDFDLTCFL
ncbi:uncharacterized protein LOC121699946 [Alosa sapidissima]|uniref:uncharacterized protein LOC121699946 n=1 Tax=Alosa sapidissima TaxID=34773 RepID=UPI001C0A3184|nr:uncharacterized protein LOC121699946 [Alosa sapidissima]